MDRVTQRLWRGVEEPRRGLIDTCCSELSDHRAWLASCYVRRLHPHSRQPYRHAYRTRDHPVRIAADPVVGLRWLKSSEQRG
jgi:hypothetical protein